MSSDTNALVQTADGNVYIAGTEPKPEPPKQRYQPTPGRPTPGKRNLLRSIINIPLARIAEQTPENLAFNFKALEDARIVWGREDDERIYNCAYQWWKTQGEAPQLENLRYYFEQIDDLLVTERLKLIEAAEFFTRTNFVWLRGQEQEQDRELALRAVFRETGDILGGRQEPWKSKSLAERFEGARSLFNERGTAVTGAAKTRASKLVHVGFDEILKPLGPIPWVCEGLRMAPGGGIYMLGGFGFSAKTMVLEHIELCVASGLPVFGVHPVKQGRVLHLDYEQGRHLTYERYQRLARGMGLDFEKLIKTDGLRLSVFPTLRLDDKEAEEVLGDTLEEGFDLVGIDPFRAACPGMDENSSTAREPLDMINRVCGDKRVGVMLHHSNKPPADGKGRAKRFSFRGSGAIFDAICGGFVLSKDGEDKDGPIKVTHEKEKWRGKQLPDFGVRVVDVEGCGFRST